MSEITKSAHFPLNYGEVINDLEKAVTNHIEWGQFSDINEKGVTAFDGSIRPFSLPPDLTTELGLGSLVRCRVIGSEEGTGVAIIVRSMNPFNKKIQGFFIQSAPYRTDKTDHYDELGGYQVWQGAAKWPKQHRAYSSKELLEDNAQLANSLTAISLVLTIQKHAQLKSR